MGPKCIKNCWPFVLCLRLCIQNKNKKPPTNYKYIYYYYFFFSLEAIRNQREQQNEKSFCHSSDSHVRSFTVSYTVYLALAHMPHQPPHMVIFIACALLLYVGIKNSLDCLASLAMNAMNVKCVSSLKHINKLPHILFRESTTKRKCV